MPVDLGAGELGVHEDRVTLTGDERRGDGREGALPAAQGARRAGEHLQPQRRRACCGGCGGGDGAGLRVGWLACRDRALLERLERRKHYTSICNAGPSEHLATIALHAREQIWNRNRSIIAENLPVFDAFFAQWSELFEWRHPQGGCVSFPRLTTGEPTATFCRRLVKQAGVMLLPADIYASELADVPRDRFRVGVGRRAPQGRS